MTNGLRQFMPISDTEWEWLCTVHGRNNGQCECPKEETYTPDQRLQDEHLPGAAFDPKKRVEGALENEVAVIRKEGRGLFAGEPPAWDGKYDIVKDGTPAPVSDSQAVVDTFKEAVRSTFQEVNRARTAVGDFQNDAPLPSSRELKEALYSAQLEWAKAEDVGSAGFVVKTMSTASPEEAGRWIGAAGGDPAQLEEARVDDSESPS